MADKELRIILASPRGFCAGVDRAIDTVEQALALFGPPIYVKHEIVHNKHVVGRLREKGTIFVEELSDIPDGAVAIFSAHGIPKAVREEAARRPLRLIDATCPLVTKVHLEVHKMHRDGYEILLIGHAGHVEVIGTMGQLADGRIKLVRNVEEAAIVEVENPEKVAYVTQTTLSLDETRSVVEILRKRFPKIKCPAKDDICYATQNRQNAVKEMAGSIDLLLVIGSKNSSNSNRLVEVARANGVPGYLIDDPGELNAAWFEDAKAVGLTAGASAPEDLVRATIDRLISDFGASIESVARQEETIEFALPPELEKLARSGD